MDDYSELIKLIESNPELALIPIALLVGKVIKNSKIADEYIPYIIMGVSTVIGFLIAGMDVGAAIKGFLAAVITVGGHASVKQWSKLSANKAKAKVNRSKIKAATK
jgi:hypothetical protein